MSYLVQFHGGPDRDASYSRNDPPPAVIVAEQVLDRRWDGTRFVETVRSYWYERRNFGGEQATTHYDYRGATKDD